MDKSSMDKWAEEVARENDFKPKKLIYQGTYYSHDNIRDRIYSGEYRGRPAVLKLYNDPRLTDEARAQVRFNQKNQSQLLVAPQVFRHEMTDWHQGWLIMEDIAIRGYSNMASPLVEAGRKTFLNLYREYRQNFPLKPEREMTLAEELPSHEFHTLRIKRWLALADDKETSRRLGGEDRLLDMKTFVPLYTRALDRIRAKFKDAPMVWCHGHFKPKEIFQKPGSQKHYLTDFAHNHMFPLGYELAFIIWSDWLMPASLNIEYQEFKQGIEHWIQDLEPIAKEQKVENYREFIRTSLLERVLGTILADILATDKPIKEKQILLQRLLRLLRELLDSDQ